MSSVNNAAKVVKELGIMEYKILKIFTSSIKHHEALNMQEILSYSKLHKDRIEYSLSQLLKLKLIAKTDIGFKLVSSGLDVYALKILVNAGIISGIGMSIGIGKESDVVEAISELNQRRAVKFFRIGRISFTDTKRKRSIENSKNYHSWLLINIEAAKKEYDVLVKLKESKMNITTPFYRSMHTIVMDRINGIRLSDLNYLQNPSDVFQKILDQIKISYSQNMINGDISEYNVMLDNNNKVWIIDWPQAVTVDHPNSKYLIKRDIRNILRYFKRKYGLQRDEDSCISRIVGAA